MFEIREAEKTKRKSKQTLSVSLLNQTKKDSLSCLFIFCQEAADIFVFSSDVSVSGRVSSAISSPDSAGVIKENVKRQEKLTISNSARKISTENYQTLMPQNWGKSKVDCQKRKWGRSSGVPYLCLFRARICVYTCVCLCT